MEKKRLRVKRSKVQFDGSVTVRRFVPPQLCTTAVIRQGVFLEPMEEVAQRVGVDPATVEGLVNMQGLAFFGRLFDGAEVFLAGAVVGDKAGHMKKSDFLSINSSVLQLPDVSLAWAYDPRMLLHSSNVDRVPETPYRLQRAVEFLQSTPRAAELLPVELRCRADLDMATAGKGVDADNLDILVSCWIPPRMASLDEITLCHDAARYTDFIEHGTMLAQPLKTDVYCNGLFSSVAVRLAVGAVIDAARRALYGNPSFAFCLVRPPGHHCTADTPGGFCLANNVAIAARQLLSDWSEENKKGNEGRISPPRIAIVDLDVHHGEGTQSLVEEVGPLTCSESPVSPLLYLSLHRYDHGTFYPYDTRGDTAYVGRYHNVCNVAVNTAASDPMRCEEVMSDELFERVVDDVFIPRLENFCPDVVLLSLGFDAAYGDPLGRMAVEGGFAYAVRALKQFCRSHSQQQYNHSHQHHYLPQSHVGLVVVLEGGYFPEAVARGVVAVAHALRYPGNDADVMRYAARQVPKTWQDVRRRVLNQQKAMRQQLEEKKKDKNEDVGCEENSVGASCKAACKVFVWNTGQAVSVPEDEVLLERHQRWCDRLILRVLNIHTEANRL